MTDELKRKAKRTMIAGSRFSLAFYHFPPLPWDTSSPRVAAVQETTLSNKQFVLNAFHVPVYVEHVWLVLCCPDSNLELGLVRKEPVMLLIPMPGRAPSTRPSGY